MAAPPPLTPEQQRALEQAGARSRAFTGAAKLAAFNGWSIGIFAALTLLFSLFDLTALVVGLGMAVVARNEFKGRAGILRADPTGPELLWKNQLGFMGLIIAYCLWSMYRTVAHPDPQLAELTAELTKLVGEDTENLVRSLTLTVYWAVIAATALVQGLNALYYFRRVARIKEYVRDTPDWVLELQRPSLQ